MLEQFLEAFEKERPNVYEVHGITQDNFFSKTYSFYNGENGSYKVETSKKKVQTKTTKTLDKKQPHIMCSLIKYDSGQFIVNVVEYHK